MVRRFLPAAMSLLTRQPVSEGHDVLGFQGRTSSRRRLGKKALVGAPPVDLDTVGDLIRNLHSFGIVARRH